MMTTHLPPDFRVKFFCSIVTIKKPLKSGVLFLVSSKMDSKNFFITGRRRLRPFTSNRSPTRRLRPVSLSPSSTARPTEPEVCLFVALLCL